MGWMRTVVAVAATSAIGCGGEPHGEVTVATYNVALAPGAEPLVDERVDPIAEALEALDADVVCLQEVWDTRHLGRLRADFGTLVRHPDADDPATCLPGELEAFAPCIEENCDGLCAEELLTCGTDFCGLATLSFSCLSCAQRTANICVDEVLADCDAGTETAVSDFIYPSYDTALLTRLPTLDARTLPLDSTGVRTALAFARIESEAGEADVYCAHFASPIGEFVYDGPHGSWQGERAFQIQQTLDYIAETSGDTRRVILLGDLNERIAGERLAPIEAAGIRSAAEVGEPGCTVCADNLLDPSSDDRRVDHVYLGDRLNTVSFERIFDEPVTVEVLGTDPVETVETHLSDHYGLRAVISN